jgi:hypothetical protein
MKDSVEKVCATIVQCRMNLDRIELDPHWRLCENVFWNAVNTALRQEGETPWLHDTFILTMSQMRGNVWPVSRVPGWTHVETSHD